MALRRSKRGAMASQPEIAEFDRREPRGLLRRQSARLSPEQSGQAGDGWKNE